MKNDKKSRAPVVQFNPYFDRETPGEKDAGEIENEIWNPNKAQFEAFLVRDFELAQSNVQMTMLGSKFPMSVKDLKEASMHSIDTIERVVVSKVASGLIREIKEGNDKGKFELCR